MQLWNFASTVYVRWNYSLFWQLLVLHIDLPRGRNTNDDIRSVCFTTLSKVLFLIMMLLKSNIVVTCPYLPLEITLLRKRSCSNSLTLLYFVILEFSTIYLLLPNESLQFLVPPTSWTMSLFDQPPALDTAALETTPAPQQETNPKDHDLLNCIWELLVALPFI